MTQAADSSFTKLLSKSLHFVQKEGWRSGRMSESKPEDCRFEPGSAAFEIFKLCRRSSTFVNNKFDGYHLKSSTWEM